MSHGDKRAYKIGQPKTRSFIAIDAFTRTSAGPMGQTGKGRDRTNSKTRQSIKADLRRGEW